MSRTRALASMVLGLAAAACGQSSSWPFGSTTMPDKASLADRPALPEITAKYEAMMRNLRSALSGQLGTAGWKTHPPSTPRALCQEFGAEADTGLRTLPFVTYARFVPEPDWEKTTATIRQVSSPYGFDRSVHVVDRPDEHRLDFFDHYGATLSVQDGPKLLVIGLITGCHLRTSDHPRASKTGKAL